MKKALILAYDFPPYVSVGGLRPYSWHKYFREFGIEPVVVTRQWNNTYGNYLDYVAPGESDGTITEQSDKGTIIRVPYKPNLANRILLKYGEKKYKWIRKAVSAFYEVFQWIFLIGPKSGLYFGAKDYLRHHKVDCIIATGDPFILFRYASKLGKQYNIPWIADYRDPWLQNQYRVSALLFNKLNRYLERKVLKTCMMAITVSDFCVMHISKNVKNKEFRIVTNGFDDNLPVVAENVRQNKKEFSIALAGTILKLHPLDSFLRVLDRFVREKQANIAFNLYGINNEKELARKVEEEYPSLKRVVHIYPRMDNAGLAVELAGSSALLLFNYYSLMGTKIYDYLGIKRQVILCYANDPEANKLREAYLTLDEMDGVSKSLQADLIRETNSGIVVEDAAHLYTVLDHLYDEHNRQGYVECNSVGVEQYARKKQVEKLAGIIHEKIGA